MYEIILLILIIINIIIGIRLYLKKRKVKKEIILNELDKLRKQNEDKYKDLYDEYDKLTKEHNNKIKDLYSEYNKQVEAIQKDLKEKQKYYDERIQENENVIKREEQQKNLILNQKKKIIDKELNEYKLKKENEYNLYYVETENRLKEDFRIKAEELDRALEVYNEKTTVSMRQASEELNKILIKLEDYKARQASINEAILREKEIQEKETFYKLNISEIDIEDIEILRTIEPKLRNKEALNRLIYDVFIKKPALEMIKRVLSGGTPSGIYKITYIPTGESYIGKSTNIQKRWQEHLKSAYGLGTIAHSSLHTKMARDGVWNFTFEMLEEVPKEQLSEREKYWINFYDTKKYGMNEKEGG